MFNKISWLYSLFLNKDESLNISLFISAGYHLVNVRQAEINHRDVVLSCFHTLNLKSIISIITNLPYASCEIFRENRV